MYIQFYVKKLEEKMSNLLCFLMIFDCLSTRGLHGYRLTWFNREEDFSLFNKTTPEMAARDGYPMEVHYVTTSDGYILGTHRIPYSNMSPATTAGSTPKPAVILFHGIALSSSSWLINSPGKRLPYILADAGYDVWLGNSRGNLYSRNHTLLSPDEEKFWDFSSQEMALYDLPALIDYVLERTGVEKVSYVGTSMGATIYFMLTSTKPSYNEKITVSIALAPIAFAQHMESPPAWIIAPLLKFMGSSAKTLADFFSVGNNGEFVRNDAWEQQMAMYACASHQLATTLCSFPFFFTFGFDYKQLNLSIKYDLFGHFPQGTSVKTFIHYVQLINSGRFCMFDYGVQKNQEVYNADEPPDFDLQNVSAPLYIIAGRNDLLATAKDLEKLRSRLTGVEEVFSYVDYPTFNHLDFIMATDVNKYVYYPVMKILSEHNGMGQ